MCIDNPYTLIMFHFHILTDWEAIYMDPFICLRFLPDNKKP